MILPAVWASTTALIHASPRRFGHRSMPIAMTSGGERLHAMMLEHGIDLVLDVGANTGQFARQVFERGYPGRIVSFEPQSAAHAALLGNSARSRSAPFASRGESFGSRASSMPGAPGASRIVPAEETALHLVAAHPIG